MSLPDRFLLSCAAVALLSGFVRSDLAAVTEQTDDWDRQIIAACLILEASNQGEEGMRAVASVIANRARHLKTSYAAVVRKPYAFTALNEATTGKTHKRGFADHVRRASQDRNWAAALRIVDKLAAHQLPDNTYGADHYSRRDELPSWSHGMRATTVIGDHLFFKTHRVAK